jgi:hypothetical protein
MTTIQSKLTFLQKHNLAVVILAPLLAIFFGTVLNIWYNQTNIYGRLAEQELLGRFFWTVLLYNSIVYTALLAIWLKWIVGLKQVRDRLRSGQTVSEDQLRTARARTINIPWMIGLLNARSESLNDWVR